jgi:hypothetical protein
MRLIALLFFALVLDVRAGTFPTDDCASIQISYTTQSQADNNTVKIILDVKGGKAPYYFIFFDKNNNPMSWDFDRSYFTVENNKYPKYAKVRDDKGCIKVIEFNESAK